uniref:Uncharacterized protein n=1 Tax=Oryza glumipatula TaxID=40148 RepID=A0A0D9YG27_9ORYZ
MMNSSYGRRRRRRRAAGLSNYGSNQASHAGGFASSHGRIPNSTAGTDCSPPPARRARGAPPRATPVARPWTLTPSTTAPAAMDAVCVPCPIMSRADIVGVRPTVAIMGFSSPARFSACSSVSIAAKPEKPCL